jgi:DNA polymerase II small subunit
VTGNSTCEGRIEDFVRFFNDRLGRLRRILRNRRELNGAVPVGTIRSRRHDRDIRTIGMVSDVRRTPNGRIIADIEDETGSFRLLLPAEERPPVNLMKDEVIGVVGKLSTEGDIIWVQSIVRPDIPLSREPRRAERPVCAAFISDIHVGSRTFLEGHWRRFASWLNGREKRHQDYARRIEYLVVAGDLVDGIGVYPDQEADLLIRDVYRQYQVMAEMLREIPERIHVMVLPGNHDAVRPAEPQPTFPPEITKLFDSRITFLGNPCQFSLEGVEVLAYHGMSIADFISTVPGLSFNTPLEVMKEMLRRRHLAPVYGDKTPLAPENRDWMVMDSVPDIFVTGHVHGAGMENYRGVVLINASTWQSQTDYQRMMNFQPQPARVAVVDLASLEWRTVSFDGQ